MIFDPIRVITRAKKNGIGTHFGVLFPDGIVYDYAFGVDLRQISLADFSDGAQVAVVREIPWHMANVVHARLDELSRNPRKYHLLEWNCETFAEWLTSGTPRSSQVASAVVLTSIVALLAFAARTKN